MIVPKTVTDIPRRTRLLRISTYCDIAILQASEMSIRTHFCSLSDDMMGMDWGLLDDCATSSCSAITESYATCLWRNEIAVEPEWSAGDVLVAAALPGDTEPLKLVIQTIHRACLSTMTHWKQSQKQTKVSNLASVQQSSSYMRIDLTFFANLSVGSVSGNLVFCRVLIQSITL